MPIKTISLPAEYGYYLEGDFSDIFRYLSTTPIPEEGNLYVRDSEDMHAFSGFARIREEVFGLGEMESGYVNGNNKKLNCLEAHSCPEVDLAVNDQILLLALPRDIQDGKIDSKKVIAVHLKAGEVVVLRPYVLHFSPCMVDNKPFRCGIFLSAGTNRDLASKPSNPLLWKENKWLYAHPESNQAKLGAYIGITGENILVP